VNGADGASFDTLLPRGEPYASLMEHITVLLPNTPGMAKTVTDRLAEAGVSIRGLHLANTGRTGFLQLVCEPHEKGLQELTAAYGHYAVATPVVAVPVQDVPGSIGGVLKVLAARNWNIAHAYLALDSMSLPYLIVEVDESRNLDLAVQQLAEAGINPVNTIG
jgi:hypothetical protein